MCLLGVQQQECLGAADAQPSRRWPMGARATPWGAPGPRPAWESVLSACCACLPACPVGAPTSVPPHPCSAEPPGGSKTSLATLRRLLASEPTSAGADSANGSGGGAGGGAGGGSAAAGSRWDVLWGRVAEVATATLFAAQDAIPHCANSFELFGFDVMIDAQLKVGRGMGNRGWLVYKECSRSMWG